jgi:hypothetical protein
LQEISPPLANDVVIGHLSVPIPRTARAGDRYDIEILNPSGASDSVTAVSFEAVNGSIVVIPALPACVGDCDDDRRVVVSELVRGVRIALNAADLAECSAFNANETTE